MRLIQRRHLPSPVTSMGHGYDIMVQRRPHRFPSIHQQCAQGSQHLFSLPVFLCTAPWPSEVPLMQCWPLSSSIAGSVELPVREAWSSLAQFQPVLRPRGIR